MIGYIFQKQGDNMTNLQEAILKIATKYEGVKEIPQNKGWKNNPEFTRKMKDMGWKVGEPWCMYFCKLVVYEGYMAIGEAGFADIIRNTLSGSVLQSLKKLKSCNLATITMEPEIGAIGFMQKGQSQLGHAFLIYKIDETNIRSFTTIEGNTDGSTGSREGDGVYRRTRVEKYDLQKPLKIINYVTFKA